MKTPLLFLILFLLFKVDAMAQSDSLLRKIAVNINVNYSQSNASFQPLIAIYPMTYQRFQLGFSTGFDQMKYSRSDTFSIQEKRIPLLASLRYNITRWQELYFKGQLGTAVTMSSKITRNGNTFDSNRDDIGAPVLASFGFGFNMPVRDLGIGVEFGYSFRQTSNKTITNYDPKGFYFGAVFLFP